MIGLTGKCEHYFYHIDFHQKKRELATDFELLKQPGVYILEKMRTILLMNAEFNMNNKWIGWELMYWAEQY